MQALCSVMVEWIRQPKLSWKLGGSKENDGTSKTLYLQEKYAKKLQPHALLFKQN